MPSDWTSCAGRGERQARGRYGQPLVTSLSLRPAALRFVSFLVSHFFVPRFARSSFASLIRHFPNPSYAGVSPYTTGI